MQHNLTDTFLSAIPTSLLDVPRHVYELTGIEVAVKDKLFLNAESSSGYENAPAMLDIDGLNQSITIWVEPEVTPGIFAHELIHLRRNILERVPKIFPYPGIDRLLTWTCEQHENQLEHLVIVPEELSYYPEHENLWAETYRKILNNRRETAAFDTLCFQWAFLLLVLYRQTKLIEDYADGLRKLDMNALRQINNFRAELELAGPDKIKMIHCLYEFFPRLRENSFIGCFQVDAGALHVVRV